MTTLRWLIFFVLSVSSAILFITASPVGAAWETVVRAGFDSNVNRDIDNEKSDTYASFRLLTEKEPTGESRMEWTYAALVEATVYNRYDDLNSIDLSFTPGLVYRPHLSVTIGLYPFVGGQLVSESDLSCLTVGGQASLRSYISPSVSLNVYYSYRESFANNDIYSYGMHSAGIGASMAVSTKVVVEAGYEFGHGDSFLGLGGGDKSGQGGPPNGGQGAGNGQGPGGGQGNQFRGSLSPVFGESVVKETVNRHTFEAAVTVNWSRSWFSSVQYAYTSWRGDSGTASSHGGYLSAGYRF